MSHVRPTTRWLVAFFLSVAFLAMPVVSIPTCCCANSNSIAVASACCCCCSDAMTSSESQCCRPSTRSDDSATKLSCDRKCRCGHLSVTHAFVELSRTVKLPDRPVVALLNWNSILTVVDSIRVLPVAPSRRVLSHNARQASLSVWLK